MKKMLNVSEISERFHGIMKKFESILKTNELMAWILSSIITFGVLRTAVDFGLMNITVISWLIGLFLPAIPFTLSFHPKIKNQAIIYICSFFFNYGIIQMPNLDGWGFFGFDLWSLSWILPVFPIFCFKKIQENLNLTIILDENDEYYFYLNIDDEIVRIKKEIDEKNDTISL